VTGRRRSGWTRLLWAAPAALVIAIYWPALRGWYLGDDFSWLFWAQRSILSPAVLIHPDAYGYFRPVPHALTALELALHGDRPALFIGSGIALHAANATLLAVIAWLLSGRRRVGWAAGACFAVITHDWFAVPWIAGRTETCAAFFGLLSVASLIRWRQTGAPGWYAGALIAFVLTATSKESALYFWPVLIAVDLFLGRRERWWWAHVPFAVLVLGVALAEQPLHAQRLAVWRGSILDSAVRMPRNLVYVILAAASPLHTRVPDGRAAGDLALSLSGAVVLALAAAAAPRRWAWVGLAWLVIAAAPLSAMKPRFYFSWYGYGPAIAVALLAAGAMVRALDLRSAWRAALALAAAAAYVVVSLGQFVPSRRQWIANSLVLKRAAASAPTEATKVDLVNLPVGGLQGLERYFYLAYIYRDHPIPKFDVVTDPRRPPGIVAR